MKSEQNDQQVRECRRIYRKAFKEIFVIALSVAGVYLAFSYVVPLFLPFILALILAKILLPVIRFVNKKIHGPLVISAILVVFIFLSIAGTGLFFLGKVLYVQLMNLLQDIPIYQENILHVVNRLCNQGDKLLGFSQGTMTKMLENNMNTLWEMVKGIVMSMITNRTVSIFIGILGIISIFFIFIIAVINIIIDYEYIGSRFQSTNVYKVIHPVTSKLGNIGAAYVKTQLTIMSINATLLVTGLFFLKYKYAILIGLGIGIMDAFPVIGSGLFLVPMAVIAIMNGKFIEAIILVVMYGLCELSHTLIEPKLLGGKIGIRPIFMVMAMYIGVELLGVLGFLLGPLAVVIIKTIVGECLKEDKTQKEETDKNEPSSD